MGVQRGRRGRPRLVGFGLPERTIVWRWAGIALAALIGLLSFALLRPQPDLPAAGAAALAQCDTPGEPSPRWYGRVEEEALPWTASPPPRLSALRAELGADRLIAAFRTTFLDPLFDEEYNVALAADYLAGAVVEPGAVFSQNNRIGPHTRDRGYRDGPTYIGGRIVPTEGGGVCKISSNLYNVVTFSDLPIVERHAHSMLVPYVPPGRDATVAYGVKDFRFRNDRDTPIAIWADTRENTLFIAFYGRFDPPRVTWHHEELARQPAPTIRVPNPNLRPGEERVTMVGYDGLSVRTWVNVTYPGEPTVRRERGVDTYRPLPRVVEYGP